MNHNKIGTLFIEQLTNLDCAVFVPNEGINGFSWHVSVELTGTLDDRGFVYDFSHLKKLLRKALKDSLDHALILPVSSKGVHFSESGPNELWQLRARCRTNKIDCEWTYQCPEGAVYPLRCVKITNEILENEIAKVLRHRLPDSINGIKVSLAEESAELTAAFFHYTHGITRHDGLCQRMFHGHRSRIEIHVGEERRPDLEHYTTWDLLDCSVHIACPNQVIEGPAHQPGCRGQPGDRLLLAYEANAGVFRASLPAEKVFMVEGETSIECIAQQLAQVLKAREDTHLPVQVRVYEGIRKGAVALV